MEKGKAFEFVAPDGGFGYVIMLAVFINLSVFSAFINCYGIIYKDFFTELGMDSTNVTALSGINAISSALASLMTPYFLTLLTKRKTALNFGQGLIYNVSTSALNEYFVKRRTLAISVSQTLLAVVCLAAPQCFNWSLDTFGHRSTLIWVCAVSAHMFIASAIMQPVSWHMKKIEIPPKEQELKILLKENLDVTTIVKDADNTNINLDKIHGKEDSTVKKIIGFMNTLIDIKLFKKFFPSIECAGSTLVMVNEFTFLMILPQALQSFNWREEEIAWAFSMVGCGDLLMRILLIVLTKWINKWGSRPVYVFGIILGCLTRLGMLITSNQLIIYTLFVIMGMSRCILLVVILLVISESVEPDEFSSAIGVCMTMIGAFSLTLGPLLGAIRDYTESYTITFYVMSAIMGTVGVVWTVKLVFKKKRKTLEKSYEK
ncbi:unnamed protein product [Leptosia nina]|uniref:Major facilitator superfamily (MFS) profile domain-containing protein n=1 Tax=Leptosia nina TaxID=320188 RepID=A0AAV1IVY2_9NEOP